MRLIVVAVPVPQIQEQIVDVIKVIPGRVDVETNRATDRGCASAADPGGNRGACCW